jgi:hypothetical protein
MSKPTLAEYRKLWTATMEVQKRQAIGLNLPYKADMDTGRVEIQLRCRTFTFDGLTAAGTALDMLETERHPPRWLK